MQRRLPAVYMRGGTSKAVFFHDNHLPRDPAIRDRVILAAFGSPDPNRRQVDGMGGAISSTSKVAIISRAKDPEYDVVYNFGQVSIDRPSIDYKGNCGNISSAVGPFAVDEGLVNVEEPVTTVRIHQKNTDTLIVAEVPVKDGRYNEEGAYVISGVPGTGGKIALHFSEPGGAVTGKLFPTGNVIDSLDVPGLGSIRCTVIDAANPLVLVAARDLGLTGIEIGEIDSRADIREQLEAIRSRATVIMGCAATVEEASLSWPTVPRIAFVSAPRPYTDLNGTQIDASKIDLVARVISMGMLHKAFAVTSAIPAAGAARVEGTIVDEIIGHGALEKEFIRLGHPGGVIEVGVELKGQGVGCKYSKAMLGRTARRLMEGYVLVPEKHFGKNNETH
ncbi:MAG: 3-methylitaconate isomerase [Deltaproteobacteria bacterium]|nr:3-methylitaconate isomerase [Deltaproteobacteria bacterium]